VAKPTHIELPGVEPIPILFEDRSVLAIDKPRGWMLVPYSWQKTSWNLQAAIVSSIGAGDFWARSRGLKFLKFVHRLDAETTGILLFAKSLGAVESYSELFEDRRMEKTYLAVVEGVPDKAEWTCHLKLGPAPGQVGRMKVDERDGKESETHFRVLQTIRKSVLSPVVKRDFGKHLRLKETAARPQPPSQDNGREAVWTLIEARPLTGRTHQIRLHLAATAGPIVGDDVYGRREDDANLGLRAVRLAYADPFTRRRVLIRADMETFCREHGFEIPKL
jgi:23S rRNA pseudouridine1911/1915/1917 synthase